MTPTIPREKITGKQFCGPPLDETDLSFKRYGRNRTISRSCCPA